MTMPKHIAFVLIDQFADWEHATLSAVAPDFFDITRSFHTPGGRPVKSIGGVTVTPQGSMESLTPDAYDAIAFIGAESWFQPTAPDIGPLIRDSLAAGKVVGAICAATMAAHKSGAIAGRRYTSNGVGFAKHFGIYDPATYVDQPQAIADGDLVTAAGEAPVTFACEVLRRLYPDREADVQKLYGACAAEFARPAAAQAAE
jgi:putative intracellular protease/amidase